MPALLTNTVEYANQVLRNQKVETLNSRRTNPAGRPVEDQVALARQKAVEDQVKSDPSRFQPSQKDLLRQPGVEDVIPTSTTASQLGDESVMILSARGTFYLVKLASTYGPGIYAIDELTRSVIAPDFTGQVQDRPGETNSPILLTSIEFNQVDITSQVPCLNNVKVFYSFGQNFGQVVISGEVLLGPLGNLSYDGVNRLVGFFWKHRVSVLKKPVAISVANNSYFVYLTGLRIGQVNADFHILPFVMFGTLLDIEREKANEINASGTVITEGSLDEPSLFDALTAEVPDAVRDIPVAKTPTTGEEKTAISVDNDPWLNEILTVPGLDLQGPAGNTTAAAIQSKLTQREELIKVTNEGVISSGLGNLTYANPIPATASSPMAAKQDLNFKLKAPVAMPLSQSDRNSVATTATSPTVKAPVFKLLSGQPATPRIEIPSTPEPFKLLSTTGT